MEEATTAVVEALSSCLCCLVNATDKNLKATYVHQNKTERYMDMLNECFGIRIDIDNTNACGICEECVGHLRDAINFKKQIQGCQVKLHKLIMEAVQLLDEEPEVKSEIADDYNDDNMSDNLSLQQDADSPAEMSDEDGTSKDLVIYDEEVKPGIANADGMGDNYSGLATDSAESARFSRAREQLAMTCVVRLERLSPGLCAHSEPLTTDQASPTEDMRRDSRGVRAIADGATNTRGTNHCDICGKTFKAKFELNRHTLRHTGLKPYSCDICNKRFTQKYILTEHIRIHTGQRPYHCEICNKRFTYNSNFRSHIRIHTGQSSYSCDVCSKRYTRKIYLTEHVKSHTGQKPYNCDVCNKQFTHKSTLMYHMRIHTGQNLYRCNVCNKQFTHKTHFKGHIRIHTGKKPYNCEICDKQFRTKQLLRLHSRIHTGQEPYSCDVCERRFPRKDSLRRHIRLHTGDKPYFCNICHKRFTNKYSWTIHIKTHTTKKRNSS